MNLDLSSIVNFWHTNSADIRGGLRDLWHYTQLKFFLLATLLLNIASWIISIIINTLATNDSVIALHHNIYFGINLIGDARQVYFIPLLGILLTLINTIFSYIIRRDDSFFLYVFAASSALINFFLLLGLGSILLINFR